ncbi:MAG TPA: zinc ribbon domain-containing protein [Candidatus Acidoferrales bacterium]
MSRFTEELKVIPNAARITAVVAYVVSVVAWFLIFRYSTDQVMQSIPEAAKIALIFCSGLVLTIYILLIGYVNGDAQRRGMRYVMWTLLAMFIPNAIGIILYFILRDPPMKPCPQCAHIVRPGFTFCPHCGASLQPTCPSCGKSVEPGWANCPNCGTKLPGAASTAARPIG